jgi:hypothetical protein
MTDTSPIVTHDLDMHTLGSLERILFESKADAAREELDTEIADIQALFERTKQHTVQLMDEMDSDVNSDPSKPVRMNTAPAKQRRVSPMYVSAQLGNLISLKNLKMSMLKYKTDLHDTVLDRAYKIVTQINREKLAAGANGDVPFDKLLSILMDAGVAIPTNLLNSGHSATGDLSEDDIDAALMNIIEEKGIKAIRLDESGNPITEDDYIASLAFIGRDAEIENDLSTAVCVYVESSEEKIYIVNEKYEVLREIETEEELDLEELADETYFSKAFNLPVEISGE